MNEAHSQEEHRTARKPLDLTAVEEVPTANLFAVNIIRDEDLQYTF